MKRAGSLQSVTSFLLLVGLVAFLLLHKPGDWTPLYIKYLFDLGHIPLFGLGSLCILNIIKRSKGDTPYAYFLTGSLTVLLGCTTEFIQIWQPRRYFEAWDLLYNLLGSVGFLSIRYVLYHREVGRKVRGTVLFSFTLLFVIASIPPARAALDGYFMHREFPVIGSFEREQELSRWWVRQAEISRSPSYTTHGRYSMEVRIDPGTYPGTSIRYFVRNWQGYDALLLDLFLQGGEPMTLAIRINDTAHNEQYKDRYTGRFVLQPGPNQIRIPLEEVFNAPETRAMNRQSMGILCLFSPHLKESRTVNVDYIRLTK